MRFSILIIFSAILCGVEHTDAQDTLFDSQATKPPCTFQYPISWKMFLGVGQHLKYDEYDLIGPANAQNTYFAHISIATVELNDAPYKTPADYLDHFIDSVRLLHNHYEILNRGTNIFWGQSVPTLDVSYALPLPLTSADYTWTIIRERKVVTVNGGKFWTFVYAADADDYEKFLPIFSHLMETFFFK